MWHHTLFQEESNFLDQNYDPGHLVLGLQENKIMKVKIEQTWPRC